MQSVNGANRKPCVDPNLTNFHNNEFLDAANVLHMVRPMTYKLAKGK